MSLGLLSSEIDPADVGVVEGSATERLEAEVVSWAGRQAARLCGFLLRIAELDRRRAWERWERRSMAEWLSWSCGTDLRTAREQVRVGHKLLELPVVRSAMAHGEISYSKVRTICRFATPETERELLGLARAATAAQLDRAMSATGAAARRADEQAADPRPRRPSLTASADEDGGVRIQGWLPPELGAVLLQALDAAAAEVAKHETEADESGPAGPSSGMDEAAEEYRASRAEALGFIVERFLGGAAGLGKRLVVMVDGDALTDPDGGPAGPSGSDDGGPAGPSDGVFRGGCWTQHGITLPPSLVRRWAKEPSTTIVHAVVLRDPSRRHPEDLGRRARDPSAGLRRAVWARDRATCTVDGCGRRAFDVHHIEFWSNGGPTDYWNLTCLCRRHHRDVHRRGWVLRRVDGVIVVTRQDGSPPPAPPPPDDAVPDVDETLVGVDGLTATDGGRMDLDHTVTSLLCLLRPDLMLRRFRAAA